MPGRYSEARVPTALGVFRLRVYEGAGETGPIAIIAGDRLRAAPAHVHRACFLSENLGDTSCDCRERLTSALETIAAQGGVVVYLRRDADGRGVAAQLRGRDEADHQSLDAASVELAAGVLRDLGVGDAAAPLFHPAATIGSESCDGPSST